jgi:cellulase (glycosyl hydrolase family 5)/fibronectin type III domain protein/Fn3 domain-containing protein
MGNQSEIISWTAPLDTGGLPILEYIVMAFLNGQPTGIFVTSPSSPAVLIGLSNGTTYTAEVYALNGVGAGPFSAPSNPFTPMAVLPGAPLSVVALAADGQATIGFTQPTTDGGSPIFLYTATSSPGGLTGTSVTVAPITIIGLTDGVTYTFKVTATNAIGMGPASLPSNAVTPSGLPSAPLNVGATPGNGQVSVSFAQPASTGGSPITSYTVTSFPGVITASGPFSPIIVTGLTNGQQYEFTVTATNATGTGPASVQTNAVTPQGVPSPPLSPTAAAGNASAIVAFNPPLSNGGSAILSYTVTSNPGAITAMGNSPVTLTGLTNGTPYTFSVIATNAIGPSLPSVSTSPAVTPQAPATVPTPPLSPSAAAGNAQATVVFSAPLSNGGSTITQYTATAYIGGSTTGITGTLMSATPAPIVVTGLTNGQTYTFEVTATNGVGTSNPSVPTTPVTPTAATTAPSPPLSPTAVSGNAQAVVSFLAPLSNGGSAISFYTVAAYIGGTATGITQTGSVSPITITGLANGTAYTFTVTATNGVGTSDPSVATNPPITPSTVPTAPTPILAITGNASALVAFGPPASNGGAPLGLYTVTAYLSPSQVAAGITAQGATSPITVTGLTNGQAYTFTILASNVNGNGPESVQSNVIIPQVPATAPSAPLSPSASSGNGQAVVTFSAPSSNGGSVITGYTATAYLYPSGTATGHTANLSGATPAPITITGLTNGQSYTLTVLATNAVGPGPESVQSNPVVPSTVPTAPLSPSAIAGNAQATVSFSPPASDGGSSIQSYTVFSGAITKTGAASPLTVTGLTNGTPYSFMVYATNANGNGANSVPTAAVTPQAPATVPSAPQPPILATAGDTTGTVTFNAPTSTGGSAILSYTASAFLSPSGAPTGLSSPPSLSTSLQITGLTNGTNYTISVVATNAVGTGPASIQSNQFTPAAQITAPGVPTNVVAIAGNAQASVSFTAPINTGGSPIASYTALSNPGNISVTSSSGGPIIVNGLTNGTAYTFTVKATNAAGFTGNASLPSAPVTPSAVPGAPINVVATYLNGQATVTFDPPLSNGGSPITSYSAVSVPPGGSGTLNVSPGGPGYDGYAIVSGNTIVNSSGVVQVLHGGNLQGLDDSNTDQNGNFQAWYGNPPNMTYLGSLGMNVVRIPLNAASFIQNLPTSVGGWGGVAKCLVVNGSSNGWVNTTLQSADRNNDYIAAVDSIIRAAQAQNCYVILDLHFTGVQLTFGGVSAYVLPVTQSPFMDGGTTGISLAFWTAMANRYGTQATPQTGINNNGILFELFNEPYIDQLPGFGNNATCWSLMRNGGTVSSWKPNNGSVINQSWTCLGFNAAVTAIRGTGARNVLIYGSPGYCDTSSGDSSFRPTSETLNPAQLAASIHLYPNGTYPYSDGNIWPNTGDSQDGTSTWYIPIQAVINGGTPALMTEFGGSYGPLATSGEPYVQNMVNSIASLKFAGGTIWEAWPAVPANQSGGWSSLGGNDNGGNCTTTSNTLTIGMGVVWGAWLASFGTGGTVSKPAYNPQPPQTSASPISVTIASSTSGATIIYTTNGTTPSRTNGTTYAGVAVVISTVGTTNLQSFAFKTGLTDSGVSTGLYTITSSGGTASAPTNVTAYVEVGAVSVRFGPPTSNGGSAITGYIATTSTGQSVTLNSILIAVSGAASFTVPVRRIVISGVPTGSSVTVLVRAINGSGPGAVATSNAVTPLAVSNPYINVPGSGSGNTNSVSTWGTFPDSGLPTYGVTPPIPNPVTPSNLSVMVPSGIGMLPFFIHANPNITNNPQTQGRFNLAPYNFLQYYCLPTGNTGGLQNFFERGLWVDGVVTGFSGSTLTDSSMNFPNNGLISSDATYVLNASTGILMTYGATANTATTITIPGNPGLGNTTMVAGNYYEVEVPDQQTGAVLNIGGGSLPPGVTITANGSSVATFVIGAWNFVKIPLTSFNGGSNSYPQVSGTEILKYLLQANNNATFYICQMGFSVT